MSERKGRLFKFLETEVEQWQKAADRGTGGNLTEWIRQRCNAQTDTFQQHVRKQLKQIALDLRELKRKK